MALRRQLASHGALAVPHSERSRALRWETKSYSQRSELNSDLSRISFKFARLYLLVAVSPAIL